MARPSIESSCAMSVLHELTCGDLLRDRGWGLRLTAQRAGRAGVGDSVASRSPAPVMDDLIERQSCAAWSSRAGPSGAT